MMSNFLYGKLSDAEMANRLDMKDSIAKDAIVNTAGLAKDWMRKIAQPLQDAYKTLVP